MIPVLYSVVQKTLVWKECLKQPAAFYSSAEAQRVADNLLIWQAANGGWNKNEDMAAPLTEAKKATLVQQKRSMETTIDNGATHTQLVYLARVSTAAKTDAYQAAFFKGLDYLLAAQYPNGGWPQYWPLRKGYYTHITFNDDAMVGVLSLLREVAQGKPDYTFVDPGRRAKCAMAVAKGVECILRCQVVRNGKKTVWCAQHDEVTLAPAKARAYELPSLSGMESVSIVRFLMAEKRTPEIAAAIEGAVAWYQDVKLTGIRFEKKDGDKVVIPDPAAPPLWARFYDLETNKPFFCGRDGIKKSSVAEIEKERRTGYQWYGNRAQSLLEVDYPKWKRRP